VILFRILCLSNYESQLQNVTFADVKEHLGEPFQVRNKENKRYVYFKLNQPDQPGGEGMPFLIYKLGRKEQILAYAVSFWYGDLEDVQF
jgi:hypothetical protein